MEVSHRFFFKSMFIAIMMIGVLQFFDLPKYLDYTLLIVAIVFGSIGIMKKFKGWNDPN